MNSLKGSKVASSECGNHLVDMQAGVISAEAAVLRLGSISCSDYVGGGPLTAAKQTLPDMKMSL